MFAIETKKLTKRFDAVTAVNEVSLQVVRGEIFGLLGPNGAGKTTIIKMLSTLLAPTAGEARVWGNNVRTHKNDVRRSIGMVFQDPAVDDRLTGRENLDFHARMYGIAAAARRERIGTVLDLVGLADKADMLLKNYSGGMKRRLEIARGLMHFPRVLFLDEPTLGLDPQTRFHIWEYIRQLNRDEGVTIILTTHYMEEADELCSRIGIIDHGDILVVDSPAALKNAMGNDLLTIRAVDLDRLHGMLEGQSWARHITRTDSSLVVGTESGEEKIPLAVQEAHRLGIAVTAVSSSTPTLEDVFLHYTGRSIREDSEAGNSRRAGGHG